MTLKYRNGEEYYNRIYLFFNATVAVTILPLAILLLKKQSNQLIPILPEVWMQWSLAIILNLTIAATLYWSIGQYKTGLSQVKKKTTLRSILDTYYKVSSKKFLSLMLVCGICVAGYYTTVNGLFIVAYVITMIFLSLKRPTLNLLIEELELSEDHKKILVDKLEIE
ncbi:hypothetical protein [Reichenbachiella versicolor]|uniref:hypothetical protein n=1 Tax=Reichenbachiella versicolor TaxID=1821036 RepID=UPI000D6EA4C2|nr:hypothetical protein [Reichenbachiella versicolor]